MKRVSASHLRGVRCCTCASVVSTMFTVRGGGQETYMACEGVRVHTCVLHAECRVSLSSWRFPEGDGCACRAIGAGRAHQSCVLRDTKTLDVELLAVSRPRSTRGSCIRHPPPLGTIVQQISPKRRAPPCLCSSAWQHAVRRVIPCCVFHPNLRWRSTGIDNDPACDLAGPSAGPCGRRGHQSVRPLSSQDVCPPSRDRRSFGVPVETVRTCQF